MDRFASAVDLATYMGQDVETAQAEQVLDAASGAIRSQARQVISQVLADTATVPVFDGACYLPEQPVTAVASVTLTYSDATTAALASDDWLWLGAWDLVLDSAVTSRAYQATVVYDHGHPAADFAAGGAAADLWAVCMAAAARVFSPAPEGVWGWQQTNSAVTFTPDELTVIRAYAKPRVPL